MVYYSLVFMSSILYVETYIKQRKVVAFVLSEPYTVMDFGKLLEKLLHASAQKNYALAAELGYDVSYISKWITKSMLPANKNVNVICESIAQFIASSLTSLAAQQLCVFFDLPSDCEQEELQNVMEHALLDCYEYSSMQSTKTVQETMELLTSNSHFSVNPRLQRVSLDASMPHTEAGNDMIIFTNLFTMGKEDKLSISGFDRSDVHNHDRFRIMISLERDPQETIFDSLLLIYMVTNYADVDFRLYVSSSIPCSLMLAVKDCYTHTSIITQNHRCIASNTCTDKRLVNELYNTMEDTIHNQGKKVLSAVPMDTMLEENYYMQTIIAPGMRWLIGSITEQFLPADLFNELLDLHIQDNKLREMYQKNFMIMQNATLVSHLQVLIYESTFSKYILDGQMDFFGKHITLDIPQRERHITYMKDIFFKNPYMEVRLIDGSFVEDFKKFDNPSLYLSDNLSYLRIESASARPIYLVKQKELMEMFASFFEHIWTQRYDIVITDTQIIQKKMNYYINCFQLFSNL